MTGILTILFQVESKSKDMKSKKIKFFKNISFFDFMGEWSVNDDQLVDLLHTKFFTVSAEQGNSFSFFRIVHDAYNGSGIYG